MRSPPFFSSQSMTHKVLIRTGRMALGGLLLSASLLAAPLPVLAQSTLKVDLGASAGTSRNLNLAKGRTAMVELPVDARDVILANPDVAEAVLRTPRQIFIMGLKPGLTDAVFLDGAGRQILNLTVRVDAPTHQITDTLRRLMPDSRIQVEALNDSLILSGVAATPLQAQQAADLARRFVDSPDKVINMMAIAGRDQVTIKVRVVEVQRTAIKQLGFNTQAIYNQVGEPQYSFGYAPNFGVNGKYLGGSSIGMDHDTTKQPFVKVIDPVTGKATDAVLRAKGNPLAGALDTVGSDGLNKMRSMIQAFERAGLVRTLAEPVLTAVSGESSKFLAGGEFPIPVSQDAEGRITVEYKPFGVGLGFTPVVLSEGRISLKISSEVSEITNIGAFTLTNNLTLPGLNVRRTDTTVEMPSGSSLMISGLTQSKMKQTIDALPGLTTLPVLGTLFRSRDFLNEETEMVVIVTPYLVSATSPDRMQTPADGLIAATDTESVLLGKLNKVVRQNPAARPIPSSTPPFQGPVGYVIE